MAKDMKSNMDNSLVDQHKRMAMGQEIEGQGDDFGVDKMKPGIPHPEGGTSAPVHGKHLTEAQRGVAKRAGKTTGTVNHGPMGGDY